MTVNQTELGKIKQVLNNKVDRDFHNVRADAFNQAVKDTDIMQSSLANFAGENQSEIGAKSGWLHYDEDNDILSIKTKNGDYREVGGIGDEIRSLTSVIHTKELQYQAEGEELRIDLDERYPISGNKDNVQLFVNGLLKSDELFTIDDNGLTIVVSPDAFNLHETAFVKVQYMNYVPSSATKSGISTLGTLGTTYVDGWLETGSVYADGAQYKKNLDGTYVKIIEIGGIERIYPTEDFSEELYAKLRFVDVSEAGEHTELVNDGTKNYINAVSFESWESHRNYFAFDPDNYRYRVPEIGSDIPSTQKYVIVKSIYTEVLAIAKNILSTKSFLQKHVSDLDIILDSSAGRILDISSTTSFIRYVNGWGLAGSSKIYFPVSSSGDIQQFTEYTLSSNMNSYLPLDVSSLSDGIYFIILDKIGTGENRYVPKFIPIDKFFYQTTTGGEQSGAYFYQDIFKIKIFESGVERLGDYSLPVGIISINSGDIKVRGASNVFKINNALIIYPGIKFNFPLGFDDSFKRKNTAAINASPYVLNLQYQNGSVYAELDNEDIIIRCSDKVLEYNFDDNKSYLNSVEKKACRICLIKTGTLVFPEYDRFFLQEKLRHEKANLYFENTGFLSNGAIELPSVQSVCVNKTFTLKSGARFLLAIGLYDNHRLKSLDYTLSRDYSITFNSEYEESYIFYDYDNDNLFVTRQYLKAEREPDDLEEGIVWYDTLHNLNKYYNGSSWVARNIVEVANYLNTDSSGNILSVQDIGIVKSGDGRNSGGEAKWGKIKGDISLQLDLQEELDRIAVNIRMFVPELDATRILHEFGVDLQTGDVVYLETDKKLYTYDKDNDQFTLSDIPLEDNRIYLNMLSEGIYSYKNGELVLYGSSKLSCMVSLYEEAISTGDQVVNFNHPCESIVLVSIGQVVLDPSDYTFVAGSNYLTLSIPAETDGYVRYISMYKQADIASNYMKYTRYEVPSLTNYLEIPLQYRCSNLDSIIAVTVGTGVIPRDLMDLKNNNQTLKIVSTDNWSAGEVIDVWYGVLLESGPTQPDNRTIQRNSVGDLEAIALRAGDVNLKVSDPISLSDWINLQDKDSNTFYPIIDDIGSLTGTLNSFGFYKFSSFELDDNYWLPNGSTGTKERYPDFYNWLYKIYTGSLTVSGISVKNSSDSEISEFDFIINISSESFTLPQSVNERVLIDIQKATSSDQSWYNWYSDGYLEQGEKVNVPAGITTRTLLKPYSDAYYSFNMTAGYRNNSSNDTGWSSTMNETTISISTPIQISLYWEAKGYSAIPSPSDMTKGKFYFLVGIASSVA